MRVNDSTYYLWVSICWTEIRKCVLDQTSSKMFFLEWFHGERHCRSNHCNSSTFSDLKHTPTPQNVSQPEYGNGRFTPTHPSQHNYQQKVANEDKVQEEGGIKTVTISPPIIDGMKCGNESSIKYRGFLEEWLAKNKQVRGDTVGKLIIDVKNFISKAGLSPTAADLFKTPYICKNVSVSRPSSVPVKNLQPVYGFYNNSTISVH